jgi:hypothetical protein
MNKLSFWHKLAFLTNICWLLAMAMKYVQLFPRQSTSESTLLITGLLLAYGVNGGVNICTGLLFSIRKLPGTVARWLIIANFLFLLAQLYLFFT